MYLSHFRLTGRPFPSTPDSSSYYPATTHEQALTRIQNALAEGEAMALLTGEAGTGKTLVCHCLLERTPEGTSTAFLTNSHIGSRRDLLQAVLFDLSLPYETGSEQELRLRLTEYLLGNFAAGRKTLLLVDEAHYLSVDALEELRLLCNLEARQGKVIQVVLVAQPGIKRILSRVELASLRQRLAARASLGALGLEEAIDYLLHHLRAVGGNPSAIVSDEALEMFARGTRGVPRSLNQAGHQALSLAFELEADTVDAEVVLEVLTGLGLDSGEVHEVASTNKIGNPDIEADAEGNGNGPILNLSESKGQGTARREVQELPDKDLQSYRLFDPPRQRA